MLTLPWQRMWMHQRHLIMKKKIHGRMPLVTTAFPMVDKSGVHRLRVRPCLCTNRAPPDLQFLDMGLFPSSLKRIETAFTFGVLDDFRMDNLECKTAGSKYFN